MTRNFKVNFLGEAIDFMESLDPKTREKIYYNIRKSQIINDPKLFKKLTDLIWEFRTKYNKTNTDYWLSGINLTMKILWYWQLMDSLKNLRKHRKVRSKKQKRFEKNILKKKKKQMKNDRLQSKSIDEMIDKHIGERGTEKREAFEEELRLDILGQTIKRIREEKHLTQAQLGEMVGVKKAQISKIENNLTDARFETILKVFRALNAKISFNVDLD